MVIAVPEVRVVVIGQRLLAWMLDLDTLSELARRPGRHWRRWQWESWTRDIGRSLSRWKPKPISVLCAICHLPVQGDAAARAEERTHDECIGQTESGCLAVSVSPS